MNVRNHSIVLYCLVKMAQEQITSRLDVEMTYCDLCRKLSTTEDVIQWCRQTGLLRTSLECPRCGCDCREVPRAGYPEKLAFRCPRKGCQKVMSLRHGSFFSNSKLAIELILSLILLWINNTTVSKAASELQIRKATVVDWYNFNRDFCAQYFSDHPIEIGGPNV